MQRLSFDLAPAAALRFCVAATALTRDQILEMAAVAAVCGALIIACSVPGSTTQNNFSALADALIHGHIWIDLVPAKSIDAVAFHGRSYVIEGPFPALLTLPWMLLWGPGGRVQILASAVSGIAAVALLWLLFLRLGLDRAKRLWMTAFAFAGTDLWWCAFRGDVWFFSSVVAVALTAGTLVECAGRRRGWVVGILAVCALETRFTLLPAVVFLYPFLLATGVLSRNRS